MYNRIGLQATKGQGSSGYVRANLANRKPIKSRLEFIKEMRKLKEIYLPANLKPNEQIIRHNQKRQLYSFLYDLREKLRSEGKTKADIDKVYGDTEKVLLERFERGELEFSDSKKAKRDTHMKAKKKAEEEEKVKKAFGIKNDYQIGNAFDFEAQEKVRLQKQYERELREYEELEQQALLEEEQRQRREEELMRQDIKVEEMAEQQELVVQNIVKFNNLDEVEEEPQPEPENLMNGDKEPEPKIDESIPVKQAIPREPTPKSKDSSPAKNQRKKRRKKRAPSVRSDISSSEKRRVKERRKKKRRRDRSLSSSSSLSD